MNVQKMRHQVERARVNGLFGQATLVWLGAVDTSRMSDYARAWTRTWQEYGGMVVHTDRAGYRRDA